MQRFYVKCMVLVVAVFLSACAKADPEAQVRETGQQFLEALYLGKVDQVRPMLDNTVPPNTDPSDVMNKALFINQIESIVAQMQEEVTKKGFERVEIESITFNKTKSQATVSYKAYFKDGTSESDSLFFKSVQDAWLVDVLGVKE